MYYEGCKVSVTFYPARLAAFVFVEHDVEDFVVRDLHAVAGQAAYVADAFVYVVGYKATRPSSPPTRMLSRASMTERYADDTEVTTFMEQLLAAPSQTMPMASPVMLQIALLIACSACSLSRSQAMPDAEPIDAVKVAHRADSFGRKEWV